MLQNSWEKDPNYIEGIWSAKSMIKHIDKTTYGTIKNAILTKKVLIEQFESQFGFSREDSPLDSKYAHELGIYDTLVNHLNT